MLSWILTMIDLVIEKTPVVGKIKIAIERDYPLRQLSQLELLTAHWLGELCAFLDDKFRGSSTYDKPYNVDQLREWSECYPHAFIVVVKKKIISWPLNAEKIVATVKILPLREDPIVGGEFDPYQIRGNQLVNDENNAKAVWVGDLVSTNHHLILLFLALRYKLEDLRVPVYCRTAIRQLRTILFERYGARVLNPTGADADGRTILILDPSKLKRSNRGMQPTRNKPRAADSGR